MESIDYNANSVTDDDYLTLGSNYNPMNGGVSASNYDNSVDTDSNGRPDWIDDDSTDQFPNFLDPLHALYADSDGDGLVDIFDEDNNNSTPFTGTLIPGTVLLYPSDYNNLIDPQSDWRDVNTHTYLPLVWLSFDAKKQSETSALLMWETASEINNEQFILQKSIDGLTFSTIGTVAGHGTTDQNHKYEFTDADLHKGNSFYRLIQTDYNGVQETSEIRIIRNVSKQASSVYPNPTREMLTLTNLSEASQVTVLDITGTDVTPYYTNPSKLDLIGFTPGTYILKVSDGKHIEIHRVVLIK
jgi:hypothetical protein